MQFFARFTISRNGSDLPFSLINAFALTRKLEESIISVRNLRFFLILFALSWAARTSAQQPETDRQGRLSRGPVLIQASGPIAALFAKADEGIARRDWKLAVDSLQRIIEDPEGALLVRNDGAIGGGVLYESARRQAQRQLATLPPEGLAAYRLLLDGAAKGILERARESHDERLLRTLLDRYLLTSWGDDAAELLASWLLDEGRASEALTVLADLKSFVPDMDLPAELVATKQAAALLLLGQSQRAGEVLRDLAETQGGLPVWAGALTSIRPKRSFEDDGFAAGSDESASKVSLRPTISEEVPWRYPVRASRQPWIEARDSAARYSSFVPADTLAHSGGRLFVRTPTGCAALNADDLSVLWRAPAPESDDELRALAAGLFKSRQDKPDLATDRWITESISTGHGLVFTVERINDPVRAAEVMPVVRMGVRAATDPTTELYASLLTAYDESSGQRRWQTRLAVGESEAARTVELRGGPIAVGRQLWVYVWRQNEHTILILDPASGAVVDEIVLFVGGQNRRARKSIQLLSYVDRIVYVPTDGGFLFAIDVQARQVRWAAQYPTTVNIGAPRWLPTAPLVRGGLVLLSPMDRPDLLAFSSDDGSFRWSAMPEGVVYVLGADHETLWLAGSHVVGLSLSDGSPRWNVDIPDNARGRGVLAGDFAYLPTERELVIVDVKQGTVVESRPVPFSEDPLGNLVILNHAILAIDGLSVRKYPDVERMHPAAREAWLSDRSDAVRAAALAWLETLGGKPEAALDILGGLVVPDDASTAQDRLVAARIHAHLKRAQSPGRERDEVLGDLEEAVQLSRSPTDRIRTRVALAEQLVESDRAAEAYELLWRLGLSRDGNVMVPRPEGIRVSARVEILHRLAGIQERLRAEDRDRIQVLTESVVREQMRTSTVRPESARESQRVLRAAAEITAVGWAGQLALLALGDTHRTSDRLEQAELSFLQCIRMDQEPILTASAMMRLVELYLSASYRIPGSARKWLDELETRFSHVPIPPEHAGLIDAEPTVADWVAGMRQTLAAGETGSGEWLDAERFVFPGATARTSTRAFESGRLIEFVDYRPEALQDRAFVLEPNHMARAVDLKSQNLTWVTELFLPGSSMSPDVTDVNRAMMGRSSPRPWSSSERPRATGDGHIAVFTGPEALIGVGLITGKRLWAIRREADDSGIASNSAPAAAADGQAAIRPERDRLMLVRLTDGTVVWERPLHGEDVSRLWIRGHTVVGADSELERVQMFRRDNGRLIRSVEFRQPAAEWGARSLIVTDDIVIGPDCSHPAEGSTSIDSSRPMKPTCKLDRLTAVETGGGTERWSRNFDRSILRIFELNAGCMGVAFRDGVVILLDMKSGEELLQRTVPDADVVYDAMLANGLLIALHGSGAGGVVRRLTALDVATGELVWHRGDVAAATRCNWPLRSVGDVLPTCVENPGRGATGGGATIALALVDVREGVSIGPQANLLGHGMANTVSEGWEIWPGWLILDTRDRPLAVQTQPRMGPPGGS